MTEATTPRAAALQMQEDLYPRTQWVSAENNMVGTMIVPTLCDICLDVRASIRGASDPIPPQRLESIRAMLAERLRTWVMPCDAIDECVRGMVVATIAMIESEVAS